MVDGGEDNIHQHQGENWSRYTMAVSTIDPTTVVIDLDDPPTGHRLAELVQLLSGCTAERAELAVSDPTPSGPASNEDALDTLATALVRLRPKPGKQRQP